MELYVTFRDDITSDALRAYVAKRADKLEHHKGKVLRCRVTVESPHRHHLHGRFYRVRVEMFVPGAELVAGSARKDDHEHQDAYAAVDVAFDEAARILGEHYERVMDARRHPG